MGLKLVLKPNVMSSSGVMYPYVSKKINTTHKTFIYVYIYYSWNIDCDPGFHGVFRKTTIIRQLVKTNTLII